MFAIERQDEILQLIKERKSISVNELAKELYVSCATVRRDLSAMEKAGLIKRSHGGAILTGSSSDESSIRMRELENVVAKKEIAAIAVKFIKNNSSIYYIHRNKRIKKRAFTFRNDKRQSVCYLWNVAKPIKLYFGRGYS